MTLDSHTKIFESCVRQFHDTFDLPRYGHPDNAPFAIHKLRARLIEEELKELCEARTREDELDAICDLIYVIAGTAVTYSTPIAPYSTKAQRGCKVKDIPWHCRQITNDLYTMFPCQTKLTESINPALATLDDMGAILNYKLIEAFMSVHINNMQKLWSSPPSDGNLIATPRNGKWLVRDRGGKVIKPSDHKKVNLAAFC